MHLFIQRGRDLKFVLGGTSLQGCFNCQDTVRCLDFLYGGLKQHCVAHICA